MKTIFATMFILLALTTASAQTAKIEKVWTEHNVTQNGQKGMIIHTKFSVQNMMNKKGQVVAWFYDSNGENALYNGSGNNKYTTVSGKLVISEVFTPNYENTTFSDFKLFFPYDEFRSALTAGKYNLSYLVGIIDLNSNKQMATYTSVSFTYTHSNNSNSAPANNNSNETVTIEGKDVYPSDKNLGVPNLCVLVSENFIFDERTNTSSTKTTKTLVSFPKDSPAGYPMTGITLKGSYKTVQGEKVLFVTDYDIHTPNTPYYRGK